MQNFLIIAGCLCILGGYFWLIVDKHGNVALNNYRLTGGIVKVIGGLFDGTRELLTLRPDSKGKAAVLIYAGVTLFILGFTYK